MFSKRFAEPTCPGKTAPYAVGPFKALPVGEYDRWHPLVFFGPYQHCVGVRWTGQAPRAARAAATPAEAAALGACRL
jgi:hypothetical protein